jgi:malonyl-CoA/methylmalonyl-CoA synthetase
VGVPDDEWGEIVTACVVVEPRAPSEAASDQDELQLAQLMADESRAVLSAHASAAIAAYKVPRAWVVVEALPRNAMGKVVRAELIAAVQAMNADRGPASPATP